MKNREMLQHLPAEVSTELSLNYLVLTLKHHKCMENKIFRVMKLALTTLFIFTTGLLASVRSQNMRIDFILNNAKTYNILEEIEKQTDYLFIYNVEEVDLERRISITASNQTVTEILSNIFKNTDTIYKIEGKNIFLMRKEVNRDSSPQQSKKGITGTVIDKNGEPIIGANVLIKGTSIGTITDFNGKYTLEVPENAIIQISYIGYLSQDINVNGKKEITVRLAEDTQSLDEVVVVGYGTQKKGEVASAISSIKSENFIKTPSTDPAQLIKGQVPGLSIITPDANPTSTSEISLRGITTLKASASPLVLIDGIPGDLNSVSPDDIQQIDVLKDGSAAAIYGTRGTNGVILITTKNTLGEMPTEVDVNAYISTQQIIKRLPFMNADEYRQRVKEGVAGAQDDGATTDWLDQVTRTPFTQIYNISLRGGSRTTNYVASFEYRGLNGLIKRTNNQMYYPRIEITHRMFNNKLKLNASLSGYKQSYFSGSDGGSYNSEVYRNALIYNPTTPVYNAEGKYSESTKNEYYNPVAMLNEVEGENQATNLRMFGNITYTPIEGLDIKYLVSSNTYNQTRGYYETQNHKSTWRDGKNGYASRGTTRKAQDLSELTVQWRKTLLEDHSFTLLAGYSWQKDTYQNYYMQNYDFPSDDYTYNNMETGQALKDGKATEFSEANESRLIGYFGRLNYSYKGKYMLAASIRHEGSTKFGADHKWGNFPSVSGAWNIKGENFLKDIEELSTLKLRAGFGITGTVPDDPYMSLNTWQKDTYQNYYMQNYDFPSDDYTYNNMETGQALKDGKATEFSEANESRLIGYFGRLNYSYKGKYMLAASIRHEGSTKFGADHKWGNFPSVSGAWNIKGENFLKDIEELSTLKLRAGFGITGTVPDDPYMSLNTLDFGTYVYYNGLYIKTIRPDSNANPDLRWEKKKEVNIGIDFGFLDDRISGNIDYYNRKTEDLLWDYTVPSPPYLYSSMVANAGSMRNSGIEVGITAIPIQTKDFQWTTSTNYSTNKNKLLSLSNDQFISSGYSDKGSTGEPLQTTTHRIQEGEPIGNFWGYKTIDIDDNGHWIIEGADGNPKPISEQQPTDKQVIGNGLPKHYLNWNNSISWKGFDFSVTMRGAFGFDILNMPRLQYGAPVMLARGNVLNEAFDTKFGNSPLAIDQELQYVSYYIEKGNYWKIDNITLGYTFNFNTWIKRLRIYGTVSNLATITGYSGIDPEVSLSGLTPGVDNKNRYPSTRTYTFGVSIKF